MTRKWDAIVCDYCGSGSKAFIVIKIDLPDPQITPEYAYTETAMCKKHWKKLGIQAALQHNQEGREIAGLKAEDVGSEAARFAAIQFGQEN